MNRWKCPDCKGWVAPEVTVHFCEKQGQVTPWPLQRTPAERWSSSTPFANRPWVNC